MRFARPSISFSAGQNNTIVVIIRYAGSQKATGGTVTSVGGYTIHTFTSGTANFLITSWKDLTPSGFTGTISNAPTLSTANNGSLVFTGTGTQINTDFITPWVPNGVSGYSTMTIDMWVRLTNTNGMIYTKPFNGSGQYNIWITHSYFWLQASGAASQLNFAKSLYNSIPGWVNITCWMNSTQMGYYINGSEYSATQTHGITGGIMSSGNDTNAGFMAWVFPYGPGDTRTDLAAGNLSNVKIYNRVLSAAEVQQNFNALIPRYRTTIGTHSTNPAPSGYYIAQNYPSSPSGYYWIKSSSMPNALYMYVDMSEEGGGYDFYPITGGTSVTDITATHSGTALGLGLVMPRSKYHWRAMRNYVTNVVGSSDYTYFSNVAGIYRSATTVGGNYTGYIMRSPTYYGSGAPDWRVLDGGRWWMRDTVYSEPNGDYTVNGFLGNLDRGSFSSGTYSLGDLVFNDGGSYATGTSYLVSTNSKP